MQSKVCEEVIKNTKVEIKNPGNYSILCVCCIIYLFQIGRLDTEITASFIRRCSFTYHDKTIWFCFFYSYITIKYLFFIRKIVAIYLAIRMSK